jgi:hypothetical protein
MAIFILLSKIFHKISSKIKNLLLKRMLKRLFKSYILVLKLLIKKEEMCNCLLWPFSPPMKHLRKIVLAMDDFIDLRELGLMFFKQSDKVK